MLARMLTYQKDQMPTPPVHTLYEGFESIGKTLTAFEETMSQISDTHWRKSAKRWGEKRPDDVENEDWINTNAARVPDPKPPIEILEQGFVTLHSTFDVFDSFMKKQRESEEGEVLSVPASLGKGKARTPDTGTEVESGSKGKKPIGQDSAKYHVSHSNKLDDRQISLPVRSADTEKSPSLAAEPSIKHPYDNQGSANRDELRPLKRRAVTGRERETAAAPAVLPHPRKAETWQTPVQPSRFGRPELETGYSVRSSNDRGTARDRSHSMASQLTRSTNRPSLDRRQEKMVPQASRCRFKSCERRFWLIFEVSAMEPLDQRHPNAERPAHGPLPARRDGAPLLVLRGSGHVNLAHAEGKTDTWRPPK